LGWSGGGRGSFLQDLEDAETNAVGFELAWKRENDTIGGLRKFPSLVKVEIHWDVKAYVSPCVTFARFRRSVPVGACIVASTEAQPKNRRTYDLM